jgi:uncharacterized RDD family membrane protein YckC
METVRIETAQNVALQYEVATIVDRGLAVVIDWLLLAGFSFGLVYVINKMDLDPPNWVDIVLFGVPWTFYHLVCELLMDGQSVGKRVRNIKVVRLDGGQPGLGHYLLRWLLRVVDAMFMLGAVVILFNGKGQRIGDLAAGTAVISLRRRNTLDDVVAQHLPEDHQVTFHDAARIPDPEAALIKEVLANNSAARSAATTKLADRYRADFHSNGELAPEQFLRTLLADHVFLTSR